ncbi:MAG: hypothetical protein JO333_07175 [Verrucomicrobia bacterium]|nr:hypothetical protein [Verrucomicrobiota bacterium]
MKTLLICLIGLPAFMAFTGSCGAADSDSALIVPGERIGQTSLGPNGAAILKDLAPPDAIDQGTSQTRQVWKSSKPGGLFDTLFIHTTSNGIINAKPADGVTIDSIRVTANYFHTANGISTGSEFEEIRRKFPNAAPIDGTPTVYDDEKQGIAFEFINGSLCIAIMIHPPGSSHIATQSEIASVLEEAKQH